MLLGACGNAPWVMWSHSPDHVIMLSRSWCVSPLQDANLMAKEYLLFYARLKGVKWSREKAVVERALRQVCSYTVVNDLNLIVTHIPLTLHTLTCTTLHALTYASLTLHTLTCHPHYTPSHTHHPHYTPSHIYYTACTPSLVPPMLHTLTCTTHPHTCTKVNLCDARKWKSKALLYYLCAPNSEFDCEPRYVNGYVHVWALWIVSCKSRLFHHIRLRLEWLWEFSIIHTLSRFSSISASSCESLPNPNPNFDLNPTE